MIGSTAVSIINLKKIKYLIVNSEKEKELIKVIYYDLQEQIVTNNEETDQLGKTWNEKMKTVTVANLNKCEAVELILMLRE